ncbi:hypothetical protein AVEN_111661-1 [Araneus ventricosus]|uniref:Uncharacterized protein n=1 Tax=Araneus ventricosus TaxID=182803 RepID=A0A4Y2V106_ARAVE|nr:hypothetical protein AVEN_111661-1 [Araneus ventricosus]
MTGAIRISTSRAVPAPPKHQGSIEEPSPRHQSETEIGLLMEITATAQPLPKEVRPVVRVETVLAVKTHIPATLNRGIIKNVIALLDMLKIMDTAKVLTIFSNNLFNRFKGISYLSISNCCVGFVIGNIFG